MSSNETFFMGAYGSEVDAGSNADARISRVLKQPAGELIGIDCAAERCDQLVTDAGYKPTVKSGGEQRGLGPVRAQNEGIVHRFVAMQKNRRTDDIAEDDANGAR